MPQPQPFIVGRQAEVELFDRLVGGQTDYWLLNIYGPGGIGKTVVCSKLAQHAQERGIPFATVAGPAQVQQARVRPGRQAADGLLCREGGD